MKIPIQEKMAEMDARLAKLEQAHRGNPNYVHVTTENGLQLGIPLGMWGAIETVLAIFKDLDAMLVKAKRKGK